MRLLDLIVPPGMFPDNPEPANAFPYFTAGLIVILVIFVILTIVQVYKTKEDYKTE